MAGLFGLDVGSSIGYGISKAQLDDSYNNWRKSLRRGPTYRMQGLRAAGINPILAAGGGIGATATAAKLNPAGGGGGAGDPFSAHTERRERQAKTGLSAAGTELAENQNKIVSAQLVYEQGKAEFYASKEGKSVIRQEAIHNASPNTWPGLFSRGLRELPPIGGSDRTAPYAPHNAKGLFTPWRSGTRSTPAPLEIKPRWEPRP